MKYRLLGILLFMGALCGRAGEIKPVVFDFDNEASLKSHWKQRRTALHIPMSQFNVVKSSGARDGRALAIRCRKSSGMLLISPAELDLHKTPVMRWRWRVVRPVVVRNGKDTDDQAVAIYFCDGNTLRQFAVSYRWENLHPMGFRELIRYSGGAVTVNSICMRNNKSAVGEWFEEERNVLQDFRRAFKRNPMNRFAIGVAGNSQYTKSDTLVEIDYIEFHPEQKRGKR